MKFNQYSISEALITSIEFLGFKKPTDIQYKAIPNILAGEDILAIAQTGTGKTAAYVIPILDKIHKSNFKVRSEGIKCIVLVPTRELAVQVNEVFVQLSKKLKVDSFAIFGGVDQDPQIDKLTKGIDVLVTTPGRMFDLVSQKYIRLNRVKYLVLDEADQMLQRGFLADIEMLIKFLPKRRQTLFISATINDKIKKLAYSLVNKPVRIQISPKDPVNKNIDHSLIFVEMDDKRFFLERMVKENPEKKILAFVRTKVRAERVKSAMERVDIEALNFHGGIDQKDRLMALKKFSDGDVKLLIATDVSARGIDIQDVEIVINYDLPDEPETYVHRVGRTGRARKKGIAFSFCSSDEKPKLKSINEYLTKDIKEIKIMAEDKREILDLSANREMTISDIVDNLDEIANGKRKKRRTKQKYKK